MTFHEVQFPSNISYGSSGGPQRLTQIVTLKSGFEERNQTWQHSRRKYNAGFGVRSISELHDVIKFWEARRGQLYSFRWKDWGDFKSSHGKSNPTSTDQILQSINSSTTSFQLVKHYQDQVGAYTRAIVKPVANTVLISVNDVTQLNVVGQPPIWEVDTTTGVITFTTPLSNNDIVKAGYEFDVPVRFDSDSITVRIEAFQAGTIPTINIIEVRI